MYEGGDAWITKHGGAGGRLGDYLCVDCDNLPYAGGHNQFTNTQNSPDQISKSRHNTALLPSLGLFFVQSANGAYCRHKRHGVTHDAEGDNDRSSLAQTDLARSETGKVRRGLRSLLKSLSLFRSAKCAITQYYTVRVDSFPHRKWIEIQQQPGTAGPGNMLGRCLIYYHFLWGKLSTRTV